MSTLNELLARAQEVRDEQAVGGNTALRVGQLLTDIIQWCADADADFVESVEHYVALLNERDGIINWWQSRVILLKTMGSDFDDVDVSTLNDGDLYYDNVGQWLFERENGGSANGHHPSEGVLYVNLATKTAYQWDGASFQVAIEGGGGTSSITAFTNYVVKNSTSELPTTGNANTGYIVGTHVYAYVGTGGDTADGKYQDLGDITGPQGEQGPAGADGKSAYQSYYDTTSDNPKMTEAQWVASLKGETGATGPQGEPGPQGNSGVASADGVIVVNNLTEGGTNVEVDGVTKVKVLSAEMGKELGESVQELNEEKAAVEDSDKVVLNQPILNLYGVEGEDFWYIPGYKTTTNGTVVEDTSATPATLVLIKMRGSVITVRGIALAYTKDNGPWFTTDTKPSLSNPTVDDDGNAITYSSTYKSDAVTNLEVSKAYILAKVGSGGSVTIAYFSSLPDTTQQYRIKSLNGGVQFVASDVEGISKFTFEALDGAFTQKLNQLDTSQYLDGYKLGQNNSPKIVAASGWRILLQEIPSNLTNLVIIGQKGTGGYAYEAAVLIDENFNIVKTANGSGTSVRYYMMTSIPADAKYLVLNLIGTGTSLAYSPSDLCVLYDVDNLKQYDSGKYPYLDRLYAKKDELSTIAHNVQYEDFPENKISAKYVTAYTQARNITFTFSVDASEKYIYWRLPYSGHRTGTGVFVQYDGNDNVLSDVAPDSVSNLLPTKTTLDGYFSSQRALVKLASGCTKIKFNFNWVSSLNHQDAQVLIDSGHKVYLLKDRVIPHRKPRVVSIDGIKLNHTDKTPLEGLTICCFGDSITDFGSSSAKGGYPRYIQDNYDCACIDYARGSARFIDASNTDPTMDTNPGTPGNGVAGNENNKVSVQIRWCIREMTEEGIVPDVAIINGGTNDCFGTVDYGTLETALANYPNATDAVHTNFYDCVCYFVSKLREAFPNIKIFLSTVTKTLANDSHETSVLTWNQHVFEAASALGLSVIDFHDGCEMSRYPKGTYGQVGNVWKWSHSNPWFNAEESLHPSEKGVQAMAKLVVSEINKWFPK